MKLYIFRCKASPKTYGATRYETASNLPTDSCSGGWEFYERVDLTARGTLRYTVDTAIVRRFVRHRGWHVWQESSGALQKDPAARIPWREYDPPRAEPEAFTFEKPAEYSRKDVTEAAVTPREPWRPLRETETIAAEDEVFTKTAAAPAPVPPPPPTKPAAPVPPPAPPPAPPAAPVAAKVSRPDTADVVPPPPAKVRPDDMKVPAPAPAHPARHQVVWFDIPVRDIDRAVRFYSAVLGALLKKEQAGPGAAIAALPHPEGSIGGSLVQNMDAKPSDSGPLLYLNTNGRLDEALMAVEKLGGKILAEKHSIAPFGFRAVVIDSEGNRIALHSM